MKERPILFSGAMVCALLDGSKTQTRRIVKNQPLEDVSPIRVSHYHPTVIDRRGDEQPGTEIFGAYSDGGEWGSKCPYGEPGERLWVRETFFAYGRWETRYSAKKGRDEWHFIDMTLECDRIYQYAADNPDLPLAHNRGGVLPGWWKRPAIHMPRVASRIAPEMTDVRIERLNDITDADAEAEGWPGFTDDNGLDSMAWYSELWDSLNAARGFGWEANPWVWVVEFKRIEA